MGCSYSGVKRVSIEAGVTDYWTKYVGLDGASVGIITYGESAPGGKLFEHFGFTVENVVKTVKSVLYLIFYKKVFKL